MVALFDTGWTVDNQFKLSFHNGHWSGQLHLVLLGITILTFLWPNYVARLNQVFMIDW
jgi:hypothetical protein